MKYVKIFEGISASELEASVNEWLVDNQDSIEIFDIKLDNFSNLNTPHYTCMVVYSFK